MTCYHPLYAIRINDSISHKSGKPVVKVLKAYENILPPPKLGENGNVTGFLVACGQCRGCRLDNSRNWAIRLMHESKYHAKACFLTLTYSEENLVYGEDRATLVKKHLQDFVKRLRRRVEYDYPKNEKLKFFACGEYGDLTLRPHYHIILFGFDFPDRILKYTSGGYQHFVSDYLNDIWGKGLCEVCNISFDTCAYVARYILKKQTGDLIPTTYQNEFVSMSNGIGKQWYKEFKSDVYNYDVLSYYRDGSHYECRPPRYYDYLFDLDNHEAFEALREKRSKAVKAKPFEQDRLYVKEKLSILKMKNMKRVSL